MIKKQLSFYISEKNDKDAEKMIKNDVSFGSFPRLVSIAVKKYIDDYKKENEKEEWWTDDN